MNYQPLFSISLLASHWENEFRIFQDSVEAQVLLERLKIWNERRRLKETATDAAFISLFFRDIWGYSLQGESGDGYQCYPQFPIARAGQMGGVGQADLALGRFGEAGMPDIPQVLCEFKDMRSGLDQQQNRKGNDRTPVRQCLDYLREARASLTGHELVEPAWGIVTDTNEFRLYHRLKGEAQCQRFVISPAAGEEAESLLNNTESAAFLRFLFSKIFSSAVLLSERGPAPLEVLLKEQFVRESALERDFYIEYKAYREFVFKSIVEANPGFSGTRGKLVRLTQRFLDRCLFIMFCEDMGKALEFPGDLLRNVLIDLSRDAYYNPEDSIPWERVKTIFRTMRDGGRVGDHLIKRFNGGLFEELPDLENLNIPAKVFCVRNQGTGGAETLLAHPLTLLFFCAKYNFGIKNAAHERMIDFYAIGRIFEQSITELEIMEAEADGRPSINLLSQRKRDGVYYTPEWVTAYIVEETVGARLRDIKGELDLTEEKRPNDEQIEEYRKFLADRRRTAKAAGAWLQSLQAYRRRLRELKVVDPACGSGAFLIQTLERLKREHRWIADETSRISGQEELWDLDAVINDILANNLHGVDLNAESVEITKLALWMHTASAGKPLSSLDRNIRCGNSLVGPDFYANRQPDLFSEDERERINAFDWKETFPGIFDQGGFDCVIGNPPYVKLQNFRRVQSSVAEYLLEARRADGAPLYASTRTGNFDLYLPFIEKGLDLLRPDGRMGYIAPNVWMMNEYGRGLRAVVKRNRRLDRWVDFKSFQVFDEAITYTALQFFRGRSVDALRCSFIPDGDMSRIEWQSPDARISYEELPETEAWNLMPDAERKLIDRLRETCKPLIERCRGIFVGIQTSADAIYHLIRLGPGRYRTKSGMEVRLEDAIMRPLVSGAEAKRYQSPQTDTWLLFPYDISGARPRLLTESELSNRFPLALAYLKQHEQALRNRERGRMNIDDGWWAYNYPKNLDKQEHTKLLVAQTVPNLRVSYDSEGTFYCNNVRVNGILPNTPEGGWFLLGILNARPADFIFRRIAKPKEGGWFEANKQFIAPLPIPEASDEDRAEVARQARELQRLHTLRRDLIAGFGKRVNGDQTVVDRRRSTWLCADADRWKEKLAAWDALLRPGVELAVENTDDELLLKIGGETVLELFDVPETPFIAAQWRQALRDVSVTAGFNAGKLSYLLLKLRKSDSPELKKRLIDIDDEIKRTEAAIIQTEKVMNSTVYRLYDMTREEIRMVEAG
ncbi:MAG: Type IIS restriction enzyme Eco57I [Syntrophus sp. PtaB.Bin075]|nr:MAG: Type IIS restriction enzyme Eco57I [Syntrophus sp. PtaB.Bin075]